MYFIQGKDIAKQIGFVISLVEIAKFDDLNIWDGTALYAGLQKWAWRDRKADVIVWND